MLIMALVPYNPLPITEFFNTTERILNIQGLPDVVIQQDWNNYGVAAVVWEAAIVLGTFLQSIRDQINGKHILELGSGTGVCGIVASLLGANVTLTDLKNSLQICKKNAEKNLNSSIHQFQIKSLDWKEDLSKHWFDSSYDYIIGADLVYIEELFEDLIKTFQHFSSINKNIQILLAGQVRYTKRYRKFKSILKETFIIEQLLHDSVIYILKIVPKPT